MESSGAAAAELGLGLRSSSATSPTGLVADLTAEMLTAAVVVQHHHHTHNHHATPHREPQVSYTPQQKLQIEAMNKSPAAWQPTFTSQDDRLKAAQVPFAWPANLKCVFTRP